MAVQGAVLRDGSEASPRRGGPKEKRPFRAILFDLDHTLLDTDRAERAALCAALRSLDIPYSRRVLADYRQINGRLWSRYRRGQISSTHLAQERFSLLMARLGEGQSRSRELASAYLKAFAKRGDLLPWCRPTLSRLEPRFLLGVATNGLDHVQRSRLRAARLLSCFGAIVTSESSGFAKPDPRILLTALACLGVEPQDALYVGDDLETDGGAARSAGVAFCWVDSDGRRRRRLPSGCHRVDSLAALPGFLDTGG